MKKNKVKSIVIITFILIVTFFLVFKVLEKVLGPEIIHTDVPDSLQHNEEYVNNIVLEGDKRDIKENEYVPKENSSLYNYTNETSQNDQVNDENSQKAIKLAKKYWAGSEDDNSALYIIMDKKGDVYNITLYDTVTTYAFLWLEVNVKDETVKEVSAQFVEQN